ncbi:MAG: hypothetical protein KF803_14765 [Cyclobacteriaceae bacterium]|nr:hypothetical protein [Cyclobacteriaceae bacterium]
MNYKALNPSTENLFESTLKKIQHQLETKRKDTTTGLKLLARFDELKKYRSLYVHKVIEVRGKNGAFLIALIDKHLTIIETKRHSRTEKEIEEVEPVLVFSVPQDMGKVYIRKETLVDKVLDLFTKVDIGFNEYPNFSKNYYVVGENPDQVKKHLPKGLMKSLDNIKNLTVEITGNWGLLRTERNLTEYVLLFLVSIGNKMTALDTAN